MYILANMWFQTLLRTFFFNIDKVVFNFIPSIYNLLIEIARTSVLTQADIQTMAFRIYKLLAVFMIFKVTLSLIMYVVNPDDFSDKSKGLGKLGTNIVISLALLVLVPYLFRYAFELQTIILEDNSLATLVFGTGENGEDKQSFFNNAGQEMEYMVLEPFFAPDVSFEELYSCNKLTTSTNSGGTITRKINEDCFGISKDNFDTTLTGETGLTKLTGSNFSTVDIKNYAVGVTSKNFGMTFRLNLATATATNPKTSNEQYIMDYKFGVSTAVGVLVVLLLISFCMDVALRSLKLSFYQLIAPIPIISLVDPKSGKDGMFKKWYQACFKTYISLFIRLLGLYFSVFIIGLVADLQLVDVIDGTYKTGAMLSIFIIIGALMFAKDLPKILEGLGIKLDGDGKFFLNPFKKFENQALGGKKILGFGKGALATTAAAGLAGTVNAGSRLAQMAANVYKADGFKNKLKAAGGGLVRTAASTVGGTFSAARRGTVKAAKGEKMGKIFANSYGEAMFARKQREDLYRKVGATTLGDRLAFTGKSMLADAARLTGNFNAGQSQEIRLGELDAEKNRRQNMLKDAKEKLGLRKQGLITEKTAKIQRHRDNATHAQSVIDRIATYKAGDINVKDQEEFIDKIKSTGDYYAKEGEVYHRKFALGEMITVRTKDGDVTREATAEDVARGEELDLVATKEDAGKRYTSDQGRAADAKLDEERAKALKYMIKHDEAGLRGEIERLNVKGKKYRIEEDGTVIEHDEATGEEKEVTISSLKTLKSQEADKEVKVERSYYDEEQEIKKQEELQEKEQQEIEAWYKEQVVERHVDKDSLEWVTNEAANAARGTKNSEPEGFKVSSGIDTTDYTPFTTNLVYGNGTVQNQSTASSGGHPGGHGGHPGGHGGHPGGV